MTGKEWRSGFLISIDTTFKCWRRKVQENNDTVRFHTQSTCSLGWNGSLENHFHLLLSNSHVPYLSQSLFFHYFENPVHSVFLENFFSCFPLCRFRRISLIFLCPLETATTVIIFRSFIYKWLYMFDFTEMKINSEILASVWFVQWRGWSCLPLQEFLFFPSFLSLVPYFSTLILFLVQTLHKNGHLITNLQMQMDQLYYL